QQDPLFGYFSAVAGQDGQISADELQRCLTQSGAIASMGYHLSPQAMNCIMKRYSNGGRIRFDDFISCCVRLRALTVYSGHHERMKESKED
ncbi:sorcin-like, partial [Parambassis ranga]|uniref:Sorcin-like n=1 Tax=Parambassis ranga TaxID=210632 RepID=A0A6P7JW39_9TELE